MGKTIGEYEVIEQLGTGAGSVIYAVKDKRGDRYALKHVTRREAADDRYVEQATHEHDVCQKFDHPALRKSYKLVRERAMMRLKELIVVMELVEGETLEGLGRDEKLKIVEAGRKAAEGLTEMHDAGWVHADLKPANIMITTDGEVKLIDFGQACPHGTCKERVQGTPNFIAPEQVKREPIIPQTDIFCLGATLYFLLTGRRVQTMMPQGNEVSARKPEPPFPAADVDPSIPLSLSNLLQECMKWEAGERPSNMKLVRDRLLLAETQLRKVVDELGEGAVQPEPSKVKRWGTPIRPKVEHPPSGESTPRKPASKPKPAGPRVETEWTVATSVEEPATPATPLVDSDEIDAIDDGDDELRLLDGSADESDVAAEMTPSSTPVDNPAEPRTRVVSSETVNILLIEDNIADVDVAVDALEQSDNPTFHVDRVARLCEAMAI
ncbi:MAG: protein kinase, partial [Phycisphaera sp.]|nr:protein kinase [Phycisphaera sp.]